MITGYVLVYECKKLNFKKQHFDVKKVSPIEFVARIKTVNVWRTLSRGWRSQNWRLIHFSLTSLMSSPYLTSVVLLFSISISVLLWWSHTAASKTLIAMFNSSFFKPAAEMCSCMFSFGLFLCLFFSRSLLSVCLWISSFLAYISAHARTVGCNINKPWKAPSWIFVRKSQPTKKFRCSATSVTGYD